MEVIYVVTVSEISSGIWRMEYDRFFEELDHCPTDEDKRRFMDDVHEEKRMDW